MTEETRTLVCYRLGRAKEALEEAVLLLESGPYQHLCQPPLLCLFLCGFSLIAGEGPFGSET
jgi:hypothetical protein